jgi:hypothetical protein
MFEAIKALEYIAIDTPETCMMNTFISGNMPEHIAQDIGANPEKNLRNQQDPWTGWAMNYFTTSKIQVPVERCVNIISRSGESLGEYDFFFEWFEDPRIEQVENLLKKIDKSLIQLGCLYTTVTKK